MRSHCAGLYTGAQQSTSHATAAAAAAAVHMLPGRIRRSCTTPNAHIALVPSLLQPCCSQVQQMQPLWQHYQHKRAHRRMSHNLATASGNSSSDSSQQPLSDSTGSSHYAQQQPEAGNNASSSSASDHHQKHHQQQKAVPIRIAAASNEETYSLEDTKTLVETAMLSAVSGLAFLLSTLLKLDNSLGYFLPLPIAIAACRSGVAAAWHTMMATAFLLLVLLGPLRAITYVLMHGMLAAALGSMWVWQWPWTASILSGAVLRMAGQLGYLVLSSLTMNENLFAVMLANVHNLLDRLSAALGSSGSASTLTISCMIFALLLVNGICYVFLLHVVYHVILGSMGFKLGPLPGIVRKYLYAGVPQQPTPKKA